MTNLSKNYYLLSNRRITLAIKVDLHFNASSIERIFFNVGFIANLVIFQKKNG